MTDKIKRVESKAWLSTLIIGMGLALAAAGSAIFEGFNTDTLGAQYAGRAGQFILIIGLPVVITSLILWFARFRKMPSLAFVVTLITGGMFFLFSFAEFIGGLFQADASFTIGGLMEIAVFSLPLLIVSWFLWAKPKVGGILLTIVGIGMGVFMLLKWNRPDEIGEWIVPILLCGLPLSLGLFTFIRETVKPSKPIPGNV